MKLHPYRQVSVVHWRYAKLITKYFGPYKINDRIGEVTYKFDLLVYSKIHNIFHIWQLKKHVGATTVSTHLPYPTEAAIATREPEQILYRMTIN